MTPRVPVQSAGTPRRSIAESKMMHASAPRSSRSRNSTIECPPTSSSPSQAMRMFTGSSPAAASSSAPLSSVQSWPLSSATPRA